MFWFFLNENTECCIDSKHFISVNIMFGSILPKAKAPMNCISARSIDNNGINRWNNSSAAAGTGSIIATDCNSTKWVHIPIIFSSNSLLLYILYRINIHLPFSCKFKTSTSFGTAFVKLH